MEELLNYIQPDDNTRISASDIRDNIKELCTEIMKKYAGMAVLAGVLYTNLTTIPITISTSDELLDATEIVNGSTAHLDYIQTLSKIEQLSPDWDGYDAPAIDKEAIKHCENVMSQLSYDIANHIDILPTEFGGVQIKYKTVAGSVISCDFGDKTMSYYLDIPGQDTEYNDFLTYSPESINTLVEKIRELV